MTEPIWKGGMTAEEQIDTVNLARAYLAFSAEQRAYFQWKQVTCKTCRKTYQCTPSQDYYNATTSEDGVAGPSYFTERQERGYGFAQLRTGGWSLLRHVRTPQENIAQIRAVFKPSIAELASIFNVSRQTVYNWISGEKPSLESVEKLNDLATAADLFLTEGSTSSSFLARRKLENGKTLVEIVRDGGSAQNAARALLQIAQKEISQRQTLQRRLANRTPAQEYSDIGSPMLNDDLEKP
jgi:transcriptional regulator with XRE-family HTH domain